MPEVFDRAGSAMHLPFLHMPVLPSANVDGVDTPKLPFFAAQYSACSYPCPCFTYSLTGTCAGLGAIVAGYAFNVRLFHSLLHTGLSRRTNVKVNRQTIS